MTKMNRNRYNRKCREVDIIERNALFCRKKRTGSLFFHTSRVFIDHLTALVTFKKDSTSDRENANLGERSHLLPVVTAGQSG